MASGERAESEDRIESNRRVGERGHYLSSRFRRHVASMPRSPVMREKSPIKEQSMAEFEGLIPEMWKEDLLAEDIDTQISVAIMETCGPLTLFVYDRLITLAHRYYELKDLRSLFVTAANCHQEFRKEQLLSLRNKFSEGRVRLQRLTMSAQTNLRSPSPATPSPVGASAARKPAKTDFCLKFAQKMLAFFNFNLHMAKKDILSQWRLRIFMKNLPSCKELKILTKKPAKDADPKCAELLNQEAIMYKALFEIHRKHLASAENDPFSMQIKHLYPAMIQFHKRLRSSKTLNNQVSQITSNKPGFYSEIILRDSSKEY